VPERQVFQARTTFRVDHPFFCAIRDNVTGMLLFEGVIMDPAR
jgi:serine protease inhibitor